jgi:hypothetical protein
LLLAVGGCEPRAEAPVSDPVCAAPAAERVAAGDAQGDGVCDLADAVAVMRADFDAAEAPVCVAAVDLVPDGRALADDAHLVLQHLFEGTAVLPDLERSACADATAWGAGSCATLTVGWEAPDAPGEGTFEVGLTLTSDAEVEAWSLGVRATGCELVGARVDGTAAADTTADAAGLRDFGYNATWLRRGLVTQAVVLGLPDRVTLPTGTASRLLTLEVSASCGACTLELAPELSTYGEPVALVAVVEGYALPLPASSWTAEVCP